MKVSEAEKLICPFITDNQGYYEGAAIKCITTKCMAWESTVSGNKEIDRKTVPYDMTPMNIRDWSISMENDGYTNIGRQGDFRDVYAKYEEADEGYCQRLK